MQRIWVLLAATLCMVSSAMACSCAPPPGTIRTSWAREQWYIQRAPVIFAGKVLGIRMENFPFKPIPGKTISDIPRLRVNFSGVKVYSGESSDSVIVQTGLGGGDCGYPFEPGRSYLVFADKDDSGALETSICSGTTELAYGSVALRVLRGESPLPEDLHDPAGTTYFDPQTLSPGKICGGVKLGTEQENARGGKRATVYLWLADEIAPAFRAEQTETSPDGGFCFNHLDAGKYILGAMTEPSGGFRDVGYYPGVSDRSQAAAITVGENAQPPDVDFPLVRQKLYTVAGYLRGVPDAANDSISVVLMPATLDQLNTLEPVELAPHGRFQIANVPPGRYLGYAASMDDEPWMFVSAGLELDVTGDMQGVRLDYSTGR